MLSKHGPNRSTLNNPMAPLERTDACCSTHHAALLSLCSDELCLALISSIRFTSILCRFITRLSIIHTAAKAATAVSHHRAARPESANVDLATRLARGTPLALGQGTAPKAPWDSVGLSIHTAYLYIDEITSNTSLHSRRICRDFESKHLELSVSAPNLDSVRG